MKLPSLRISHRIGLIAFAGVLGMVAVTGMFAYERMVIAEINLQAEQAHETEELVNNVQLGFLELQTFEKDFFLYKWPDRITDHADKTQELKLKIAEIEAFIARNPERRLPKPGQLTDAFTSYEQGFLKSVQTAQRLGLKYDQGLQKGLRSATTYLADQLDKVPFAQLKVDASSIFTREKDFIMDPSPKNRDAVKGAIEELRKRPPGVFGSPQTHSTVMMTLVAYEATFDDYARLATQNVAQQAEVANLFKLVGPIFNRIRAEMARIKNEVAAVEQETTQSIAQLVMFVIAGLIALLAIGGFLSWRTIARPISQTARSMRALADGALDIQVPGLGRRDEIGEIATAFELFRENTIRRVREEREAEEARQRTALEREARENAEKVQQAQMLQDAVHRLAQGLSKLADGDVTQSIDEPFTESMEQLRHDFNNSVANLRAALAAVGENATAIHAGSEEIRHAADDLSTRTEQQASSVEQTAAALEQMVATVKDSSRRAEEAGMLVSHTREGAERSGVIVQDAISAMDRIAASSNEISNIIGVIDEIAFQISLLALNAGIEAARAGDAGRGFAVVAQEVRELAQRSANAAKEINALISQSGEHVRSGVSLVGEAGKALATIVAEVQEISTNVTAIVEAAREQATGLSEINIAVNRIDQGTQQNAAMVEETTAASHKLALEASALQDLLARFKLDNDREHVRPDATRSRAPTRPSSYRAPAEPRAEPARMVAAGGTSAAALLAASEAADWEEF